MTWRNVLWEGYCFGIKQAWACLYAGLLLSLILLSALWYPIPGLARYDALFLAAVLIQVVLLLLRLESLREAGVILVFHLVATLMEIFKTSDAIGSWRYPEEFRIGIGNVPLFAGFMYSAVGSYIARIWRIFDFRFTRYPPLWATVVLVIAIYGNFFSHHYTIDLRWFLVAASALLFARCQVHFRIDRVYRRMPLLLGWILVALFIWFAENLATWARIWVYPSQAQDWHPVSLSKLIAWYLLMLLSFVLVSLVHRPLPSDHPDGC